MDPTLDRKYLPTSSYIHMYRGATTFYLFYFRTYVLKQINIIEKDLLFGYMKLMTEVKRITFSFTKLKLFGFIRVNRQKVNEKA